MNIKPSFKQFCQLAKRGNTIPVYASVLADLETPVSSYLKFNGNDEGYLLESVEGGRSQGRYSFVGLKPEATLTYGKDGALLKEASGKVLKLKHKDPLIALKEVLNAYKYVETKDLPRFCGGAVGYLSYECNRFFDKAGNPKGKEEFPEMCFMISRKLLVFDHLNHQVKMLVNVHLKSKSQAALKEAYEEAVNDLFAMRMKQDTAVPMSLIPGNHGKNKISKVKSNFTKAKFMNAVRAVKEYIRKGEAIQVVISQRFRRKLTTSPFNVYRSLRSINPSPYMFYLKYTDFTVVGSSPEMHVRCEDGEVQLRPIAGTRPRGKTEKQDNALAAELKVDPKECAEHVMLVDLGRNDLGRVCQVGSVEVKDFMNIERYSHVMHIVSRVMGKLAAKKDLYDVIRATFPAGTVSGAPKVRAMSIIDEQEKTRRNHYAGLVGYLSLSGNFDSCITIRTAVIQNGIATVQAGAGIVMDSNPLKEWEECSNKARGIMAAMDTAEAGLA